MKMMIITIFLLITCSTIYADDKKFNGYYWENTPYELKILILSGYLSGYKSGLTLGIVEGFHSACETTETIAEGIKDQKLSRDFETCSKLLRNNVNIILNSSFASYKELLFEDKREVTYYINEIDSFFKTYPLCKRKDVLYELLPELMTVWFQSGTTTTYKVIGEECSKSK